MTKPTPSLKARQHQYHDAARSMTERAPWLFEHGDRAVACKDSGLLFSWEYRGRDPSEASEQDFAHVAERAQRAFLQLRDRPSALWFTVRRRRAYDYPSMRQPDAVTQKIDDRRAAAFRAGRAYTNRYYMSALMLPPTGSAAFFERLRYFTVEEEMSPLRAAWFATRSIFAARDAFAYSAAQIDVQAARQMKLLDDMLTGIPDVQFQPLRGERRLAFLQNAYPRSGREVAAVASPGESWLLDAYLPDQYFYPGHNFGIFEGDGQHHVAAYAIKTGGYPRGEKEGGTRPGMLTPLLAIDGEVTISQCFVVSSIEEQRTHIKAMRRFNEMTKLSPKQWMSIAMRTNREHEDDMESKDSAREEFSKEADEAMADLTRGELFYGWHNLTVLAHGKDSSELDRVCDDVNLALRKKQLIPIRETLHLDSAVGGTVPGQWADIVHWHFLSTGNLADLVPWHTADGGKLINDYLTEQLGEPCYALAIGVTAEKTLYYLHTYVGDLPHFFLVGPSRTGKTVVCNYLWTRFRQYPRANVIILDRDFSCRIPTLLQGGQHVTVSLDPELRAAAGMSFAPVAALLADPEHRHWLADWIRILIEMHGYKVASEDIASIWVSLDTTAALSDRSLWTLSTVTTHLPPSLKVHLGPWIQGGQYGHFFDNTVDAFALGKLTCIELADVLKVRQLAIPFLLYIIMRVDDRLAFRADAQEREPTIIYVEEASFVLKEDFIAPHIRGWAATLAKRLTTLGLTTQSPEDYAESSVFAAIRDNFLTQIHLANKNATKNETIHGVLSGQFGLSDAIIDVIARATPKQEYVVVQPDVSVKISLDFDKETLATLRSDRLAQSIFDRHYLAGRGRPGWQDDYIADLLATEAAGFGADSTLNAEENTL
ncbi:VirB4 family type IV secretion system protein [Burkholderia gladioli]|uniref:VirB4 family type IV secretion system protein n=1 Tax=Burkholderia gladioli TaxID=28095 RepID=UPI003F7AB6CE